MLDLDSVQDKKKRFEDFRFGIEAEFLVVRKSDYFPLWHHELEFGELNSLFEEISLEGVPSCEGLDLEPPQTKAMPFVVEGYHLPDMTNSAREILPKGVEIRTPVCRSIEECLDVLAVLHERLTEKLASRDLDIVCLSHHPLHSHFSGPQNKRRHDYWQWSMAVMTTYGPDINVGLPPELAELVNNTDLEAKINYYGPALSALSVASPFVDGKPWTKREFKGQSYRMHKRSYIAPPIEFHPNEKDRYEFKVFDMPCTRREFEAQLLAFLGLLLDRTLEGRADNQSRIYDLGAVALKGLEAEDVFARAAEFLPRAKKALADWGVNSDALDIFAKRLEQKRTPALEMIELFEKTHSLSDVLRARHYKNV